MKKAYLGLVMVICLSACSQFENYLSGQVEKTLSAIPTVTTYPTATPYPTYTSIPLPTATATIEPLTTENFDLSELFVEADLPYGQEYDGDLVFSLPSDYEFLPDPDMAASQYMKIYDIHGGVAVIAIYNDSKKLQSAIDAKLGEVHAGMTIVEDEAGYNIETYQIAGVGEKAYVSTILGHDFEDCLFLADVYFIRCNAYVDIFVLEVTDSQLIIDFAKKLDERIQASSVCGIKD